MWQSTTMSSDSGRSSDSDGDCDGSDRNRRHANGHNFEPKDVIRLSEESRCKERQLLDGRAAAVAVASANGDL